MHTLPPTTRLYPFHSSAEEFASFETSSHRPRLHQGVIRLLLFALLLLAESCSPTEIPVAAKGSVVLGIVHTGITPLYFNADASKNRLPQLQKMVAGKWESIDWWRGCRQCDCTAACPTGCPVCAPQPSTVWEFRGGERYYWTWKLDWYEVSEVTCSGGLTHACYEQRQAGPGDYRFQICHTTGYTPATAERDPNDPTLIHMASQAGPPSCVTWEFSLPADDGKTLSKNIP